ncbi:hypothetical protein EDD86DRAFT_201604 [Gorgonomyces haynaldii]|nr:hypothetical protein EDD86DRAFT_201604 [Gorgonomyces haynaldii]
MQLTPETTPDQVKNQDLLADHLDFSNLVRHTPQDSALVVETTSAQSLDNQDGSLTVDGNPILTIPKGIPSGPMPDYEAIYCVICNGSTEKEGNQLVLCDGCNQGHHQQCVVPHISQELLLDVSSKWFCPSEKCQRPGFLTRHQTKSISELLIEEYPINTRVEVADQAMTFWPGWIKETKGTKRLVSYDGFDSKYDEWIQSDSCRMRLSSNETVVEPLEVVGVLEDRKRKRKLKLLGPDPETLYCQVCDGGDEPQGNALVICDCCQKAWHQQCSNPPIAQVYVTDYDLSWYCPKEECQQHVPQEKGLDPALIYCDLCKKNDEPSDNLLVICDGCQMSYHFKCHTKPPIDPQVLEKLDLKWFCYKPVCQNLEAHHSIDVPCTVCQQSDDIYGNQRVVCLICNERYHQRCIQPPISNHTVKTMSNRWCCNKLQCRKKGNMLKGVTVHKWIKTRTEKKELNGHVSTGAFMTRHVLNQLSKSETFPKKQQVIRNTQSSFDRESLLVHVPVGSRVLVCDRANTPWPAGVIEARGVQRKVSYDGFESSFDEWIPWDSKRLQMMDESHHLFQPTPEIASSVTIVGKKKQKQISPMDCYCSICSGGIQSEGNILVLCDHCDRTYHQKCHLPNIPDAVTEDLSAKWFCFQQECQEACPPELRTRVTGYVTASSFMDRKALQTLNVQDTMNESDSLSIYNRFQKNKQIEVCDPKGAWWPATMQSFKNGKILVKYDGWSDKYNEWIDSFSQRMRARQDITNIRFMVTENEVELISAEKKKAIGRLDLIQTRSTVYDEQQAFDCKKCEKPIEHSVYYCVYCEERGVGFALCLLCYQCQFPAHDHPRSSFARKALVPHDPKARSGYILDQFDETFTKESQSVIWDEDLSSTLMGNRKICAFCNESRDEPFVEPYPFMAPLYDYGDPVLNANQKRRVFWVHEACAQYSPEVVLTADGEWFNVLTALRRAKKLRCHKCKEKGANIGCFDPRCKKSYHVFCTGKPLTYFEQGYLFWCPQHESRLHAIDQYTDVFNCDGCGRDLNNQQWHTCTDCSAMNHFSSFDICQECFRDDFPNHNHDKTSFTITDLTMRNNQKQEERERIQMEAKPRKWTRKKQKTEEEIAEEECVFCWTKTAPVWKKKDDLMMCGDCFDLMPSSEQMDYEMSADTRYHDQDFVHRYYATRTGANKKTESIHLETSGPTPDQYWSLFFMTSFFDIPSRAPRWATHTGSDYHGSWVPQIPRWSLKRYTSIGERILSNFIGRGTDGTEALLLERRLVGIDVNPASVALAIRNTSFTFPKSIQQAIHQPIIVMGDARQLHGDLFADESYDHVLSHPPYKDCVNYSTLIEGDLSRYSDMQAFQDQMQLVAQESWRVLKPHKRLTLGIGDNRRDCYFQPVSFQTIWTYIENGFELEELIVKRQRHTTASALGTYLCYTYDFLKFTHEFVAILRKSEPQHFSPMSSRHAFEYKRIQRLVPVSPIDRKSIVMGSVWTFVVSEAHTLSQLVTSKIVQRFGTDHQYWELVDIEKEAKRIASLATVEGCPKVDPIEQPQTDMTEYERERLMRRDRNMAKAIELGLICELSADGQNDAQYFEALMQTPPVEQKRPCLIIIPHIDVPSTRIFESDEWISDYRRFVVDMALEAKNRLDDKGLFIVGVKDIKVRQTCISDPSYKNLDKKVQEQVKDKRYGTKLIPLAILVQRDLEQALNGSLALKEFMVAVPDGFYNDPLMDMAEQKLKKQEMEFERERELESWNASRKSLPIVHSTYLFYQK